MTPELPYISITFRADLTLLIVRWLRDVSQAELQQGYGQVLAIALEHQARHWLIDSRRRNQSDEAMVSWLAQEYLPGISARLQGQSVRLACLVAATWQPAAAGATPLAVLAKAPAQGSSHYHIQLFGDEGAAMQWLRDRE
ncbi:hypothetical protein [Hymenobacter rubripertinctus]|uniref:STAS/SEC14 domain-containing protein n=1 Tax=Hymenobacter rubripertinctus TaxID=2029981 RepID=A0A418R8P9_9BACT|nr:hypothetical protein [Hymenobacter rubripertinctus]RIY13863.1 hypothetical protein D0T11_01925 [Hymenobacter rubripertinctus]